jgi:hypothetical protein
MHLPARTGRFVGGGESLLAAEVLAFGAEHLVVNEV